MTTEARPHVGQIGLPIRLTIKDDDGAAIDVSQASTKVIRLQGPEDAVAVAKTAVFYTDGTDGVIQYTTASAADLDHDGEWRAQAFCTMPTGSTLPSSLYKFPVEPNLEVAS